MMNEVQEEYKEEFGSNNLYSEHYMRWLEIRVLAITMLNEKETK